MTMTNRVLPLSGAALCLVSLALVAAPAVTPKNAAAAASVATPATPPAGQLPPDDELLVIKTTPYHPTLVRDPFSAPSDVENANKGDLIDDISVKGRIVTNGKVLAVVSDSRGNVRWLPAGYKFRDGELFEISEKAVVFHQRDVNSTSGVFRTVVRPFKREGEK